MSKNKKHSNFDTAIDMILHPPKNYEHRMRTKINQHYRKARKLIV